MIEAKDALDLIESKLVGWSKELIRMLPNLVLAAVIVVAGWLLAKLVRAGVEKVLVRTQIGRSLRNLISNAVYLLIIIIALFGALSILHLDKTVTSILAGAGIVGLALGFAFQDIAANFISGVAMAVQRPIRTGELVEVAGQLGRVERIDLRTTEIKSLQGLQVIIPNKEIFQNVLTNYTRNGSRRVDLDVGVSYGDDLAKVERVTIEAVKTIDGLLPDREVELFYQEFGDSSINFEVRFWVSSKSQGYYKGRKSAAIVAIKSAYDNNDIMIPFPIRTLDFGIKGGEKLNAMLSERKSDRS
ncbi:MAG TPA: mechanosensitive ion channel [Flavobacteriales bacterium]|nr:mechanosensitive ion channel [Flavobacteriales bacterium]